MDMSTDFYGHRPVSGRCWLWKIYLYLFTMRIRIPPNPLLFPNPLLLVVNTGCAEIDQIQPKICYSRIWSNVPIMARSQGQIPSIPSWILQLTHYGGVKRAHLLFSMKILSVVKVLAVVGWRGCRPVVFDPLLLTVGVKVELMPAQWVFQLLTTLLHWRLQRVESNVRRITRQMLRLYTTPQGSYSLACVLLSKIFTQSTQFPASSFDCQLSLPWTIRHKALLLNNFFSGQQKTLKIQDIYGQHFLRSLSSKYNKSVQKQC